MIQLAYILAYSVLFSSVVPLGIIIYKRNYLNNIYRALGLVILAGFFTDLLSYLTSHSINHYTTHFNSIVEGGSVLYLFSRILPGQKNQNRIYAVIIIYLIAHGLDFALWGVTEINWISKTALAVMLSGLAMVYLLKMRYTANNLDMREEPLFWVMMAVMQYYLAEIPLHIGEHIISDSMEFIYARRISSLVVVLLSRLLLTIAVVKIKMNRHLG